MMCAIQAGQRGRSVYLIDHSNKLAEKIRISGGGRCNFTNLNTKPDNYLSANPHFCRSALARYTPQHFVDWMNEKGIGYHEKKLGQLFCDEGSEAIIKLLKDGFEAAGVKLLMPCSVNEITIADGFELDTTCGKFHAPSLVIATGGLSIPKIGATPFGYKVAQQFNIPVTKLKPGSVRVKRPDGQEEELIYVNGGLVEVQPDVVTIMSDSGVRGKDLDEAKAEEAKRAAEEAMKNNTGALEIAQAQIELAQAVAQLAAIQKLRKIK